MLAVANNKLTALPEDIGLISSLRRLELHGNDLVRLPENIIRLTDLEVLTLGHVPKLVLSQAQCRWIESLVENRCVVWLFNEEFSLGSHEYEQDNIRQINENLRKQSEEYEVPF